jgi:hypothetical protein
MLGYRSPKALQACMDGNDHQKAFQFLEIMLFGTSADMDAAPNQHKLK